LGVVQVGVVHYTRLASPLTAMEQYLRNNLDAISLCAVVDFQTVGFFSLANLLSMANFK
jgi:hypothetical protein